MKVLMIAFGHPDNVLTLCKYLTRSIDFNLIFFVSGNIYEEGVLSIKLDSLNYGLNSYEDSLSILPVNIRDYLGEKFKLRFFRTYDRKLLKDKGLRNLRKIISLIKILKKENYDLIHFNGIADFKIYFLVFLLRNKKVWTLHDYIPHYGEENKKAFKFQKFLMKFNFHHIQHYKYLKNKIIEYYNIPPNKVHHIPTGPLNIFNAFTPKFIISDKEKYILFFGRISKYKGLDILIKAFNLINYNSIDIKLVIAGRGKLDFEIEVNRNIIFLNRYLKTDELIGLIKNSLFIIVPYVDSTHSAVVATAYAFSKPVIASDIGGLSEIVKDGTTGFLFPPGDSKALAYKIEYLINNRDLIKKLEENIQKFCSEGDYSWDNITNKMVKLYETVLKG